MARLLHGGLRDDGVSAPIYGIDVILKLTHLAQLKP
jgi:hypothetical protein